MKKLVLILGCFVFIACQSETSKNATSTSEVPAAANASKEPAKTEPVVKKQMPPIKDAVDGFTTAFFNGDISTMGTFYANEVALNTYSELAKPKWGLFESKPTSKTAQVNKKDLMLAYGRFIEKITLEKWQTVWSKAPHDKISITPGVKDYQIAIPTGKSNDTIYFNFAYTLDNNKWLIVGEHTDF